MNLLVLGVLVVNLINVCVIIRVYFYRGTKSWLQDKLDAYCLWYQRKLDSRLKLAGALKKTTLSASS